MRVKEIVEVSEIQTNGRSNVHVATSRLLEVNSATGVSHVSRTAYIDMVVAGDPTPHLPFEPSIYLDVEEEEANGLVLLQREREVRRNRN